MIKGIIYDMDDLMVNSDPLHAKAWEILLTQYGHAFSELPESLRSGFIGMRVIDILKEIIQNLNLQVNVDILYKKRIDIFLDLVKKDLQAMPGLHESLRLFKEYQYQLALASSGTRTYIDLVLKKFDITEYFNVVVSGDDVNKGKPDPETYRVAAEKLGLAPSHCLVLEDATKGIASAKEAGCVCFAIANPNTPPQDHSSADKTLNSLNDITIEMVKVL